VEHLFRLREIVVHPVEITQRHVGVGGAGCASRNLQAGAKRMSVGVGDFSEPIQSKTRLAQADACWGHGGVFGERACEQGLGKLQRLTLRRPPQVLAALQVQNESFGVAAGQRFEHFLGFVGQREPHRVRDAAGNIEFQIDEIAQGPFVGLCPEMEL
jgi:hypothetical protein